MDALYCNLQTVAHAHSPCFSVYRFLDVAWNVGLRVEVFVGIEFLDVDLAHEIETERLIDSDGDFVSREEAKVGRFTETIDKLLDVLVHVARDKLAQTDVSGIESRVTPLHLVQI